MVVAIFISVCLFFWGATFFGSLLGFLNDQRVAREAMNECYYDSAQSERLFNSAMFLEQDD